MSIEEEALKLDQIAKSAFQNPKQALDDLSECNTPELSHLRFAVMAHIHLLLKPERKPRSPNKI